MNGWTLLVNRVTEVVQRILPEGWDVSNTVDDGTERSFSEALLTLTSPSSKCVVFTLVAGQPTFVGSWMKAVQRDDRARVIYIAKYLSASRRADLEDAGVNYADTTGWVRIVSSDPLLVITSQGSSTSPYPEARRAQTMRLNGRSAGRVMRCILQSSVPIGVRELARAADVSPGTVSKILPTLAAENAVTRDEIGCLTDIDRRRVLDRWTVDYGVLTSNGKPFYYVAPRGVDFLLNSVLVLPRIIATGGAAGRAWLPDNVTAVVPVTQAVLYAAAPEYAVVDMGLVPVEPSAANVILMTPQDPTILNTECVRGGIPVAPLPVVLADLLTLPGRYPQQAEALMDALAKTDPAWRS